MVCCVIVAMMFALPFILMRSMQSLFTGGGCSMAWRPIGQLNASVIANAGTSSIEHNVKVGNDLGTEFVTDRGFTIFDRANSFRYAGRGALRLLRFEHSAWIQLSIAGVAIVLALVLNISLADWRWIIVACGLVLSLEGLNTAVERTCDRISVGYCGQIKVAKDLAAGAVLLGSIAAALIGVLTFLPYLTDSDSSVTDVSYSSNAARGTFGIASSALPPAQTDFSRSGIFHCFNPGRANTALSENVLPGIALHSGV